MIRPVGTRLYEVLRSSIFLILMQCYVYYSLVTDRKPLSKQSKLFLGKDCIGLLGTI